MNAYDFATPSLPSSLLKVSRPPSASAQLLGFKSNPVPTGNGPFKPKPWIKDYYVTSPGGSANVNYLFSFDHLDQTRPDT